MRRIKTSWFFGLILLAGCATVDPNAEIEPALEVTLETKGPNQVNLRCSITHPPRRTDSDMWQKSALEIKSGNTNLPYTFDFVSQDMRIFHNSADRNESSLMKNLKGDPTSKRIARSQAVVQIVTTPNVSTITVIYHVKNTIGPGKDLVQNVQIR